MAAAKIEKSRRKSRGKSTVWAIGQKQTVTGILGTSPGAGATHYAILLANYLVGVCRYRCAVLEWNEHGDFERIERICRGAVTDNACFSVLKADYYKHSGPEVLPYCMAEGYDQIIIDFGSDFLKQKIEFLRCDEKYVIASLSEWQIEGFLEFVREMKTEAGYKSWNYAVSFGSEDTRKQMRKKLKIPVGRIPLSEDPFALNRQMIAYFEK
ncbi:MAG: hypothetical protein KH366_07705 [Clostridiaceae bacterium]|nr:hypothetical protein [Clostridiaceae bacterium]